MPVRPRRLNGPSVLLVSHEASRTGAPRVLLDIAASIASSGRSVGSILRWGGPLMADFERVTPVVLEPWRRIRVLLRWKRRWRPLAVRVEQAAARRMLRQLRPETVWANTVKSACYVRPAAELGIPIVLHVHEAEPMLSDALGRYAIEPVLDKVQLAACAPSVRVELATATGVAPDQIALVCPIVDLSASAAPPARAGDRVIVGAVGTADHRKGADLFLRMVAEVAQLHPDVEFEWVGRVTDESLHALAVELRVSDVVRFVGEVEDARALMRRFDVFTHTSRRDPYPLVVLEAMTLGLPVVAFDVDSVSTQIGRAGVLIPPARHDLMAASVRELLGNAEERRRLGHLAALRAQEVCSPDRFRLSIDAAIAGARQRAGRDST